MRCYALVFSNVCSCSNLFKAVSMWMFPESWCGLILHIWTHAARPLIWWGWICGILWLSWLYLRRWVINQGWSGDLRLSACAKAGCSMLRVCTSQNPSFGCPGWHLMFPRFWPGWRNIGSTTYLGTWWYKSYITSQQILCQYDIHIYIYMHKITHIHISLSSSKLHVYKSGWQACSDWSHLYCEACKALDTLTGTSLFEGWHWRPALIMVIKTKRIN